MLVKVAPGLNVFIYLLDFHTYALFQNRLYKIQKKCLVKSHLPVHQFYLPQVVRLWDMLSFVYYTDKMSLFKSMWNNAHVPDMEGNIHLTFVI